MERNISPSSKPLVSDILDDQMRPAVLIGKNMDDLVIQGIRNIDESGERFSARAGSGLQAYGVVYILSDSTQRLHCLRAPDAIKYLCRELLAFFEGSLGVSDGLGRASRVWHSIASSKGRIFSNYGYYVFHSKIRGRSQYKWVIDVLTRNPDSRRGIININQPSHKLIKGKDFPCTIALQFYLYNNTLRCDVFSRSADVIWGLPYDMGFFSLLTELFAADIGKRMDSKIHPGRTLLHTSFTQIYDKTRNKASDVLAKAREPLLWRDSMPPIDDAITFLNDVYGGTRGTLLMQWIWDHADWSSDEEREILESRAK